VSILISGIQQCEKIVAPGAGGGFGRDQWRGFSPKFRDCAPDVAVTMAIEFARLADMCCITGVESLMAEHIKDIILANPALEDRKYDRGRPPDTNTYFLTSQHITTAFDLPEGHLNWLRHLLKDVSDSIITNLKERHQQFWDLP